ncbi:hypothetical protein EDE12_11215 [Methylosinus sp. sav-2]|nr:hypothetical protein [Methylosinus sp. sav-2]TDX61914.1 hypothetical protein EDE12_11215 [Methylosinus sp. sav-2]
MVEIVKTTAEIIGESVAIGVVVGIGGPLLYVGWLALTRKRIG